MKKHKNYICKKCGKETSTTNEEIYKLKLCPDCRPKEYIVKVTPELLEKVEPLLKKELGKLNKEIIGKERKIKKLEKDQSKWTKKELTFTIIFFTVLGIMTILCLLGQFPGC